MSIAYHPSWKKTKTSEDALELLEGKRERDKILGTTTSGPHRDDIVFKYGENDFSQLASTGQMRLLSLILKVTQAIYYHEQSGKKPILLLDDVLLELDAQRKVAFLASLPEYEQAVFTFLPEENFLHYAKKDTLLYSVKGGYLGPWKKPAKS